MCRRMVVVGTDVLEECIAYMFKRRYVAPKRRLLQEPHSVICQKVAFLFEIALSFLQFLWLNAGTDLNYAITAFSQFLPKLIFINHAAI
jgi:hypothetical protein